jgi:hypothetical protein
MKYILLCYHDKKAWENAPETARQNAIEESVQVVHQLKVKGKYLSSSALQPVSMATSVRVRDGKQFVIDVKDLDEATGIAAQLPGARMGTIEIRPVMEIVGLPRA